MDRQHLKNILEALVFASDMPITLNQLSAILPDVDVKEIEEALEELKTDFETRALMLKKVGGGYQITTKPEYSKWVGQMFEERAKSRLSRAALETLAIIAFKQPISRVEVSAIRGVGSEGVIKKLLDARLITIAGRDSGPGRALLFKTTPEFLHYFGINEITDLPRPKEVEELLAEGEGGALLKELPDEVLLTEEALKETEEDQSTDGTQEDGESVNDSNKSSEISASKPAQQNDVATAEAPDAALEHSSSADKNDDVEQKTESLPEPVAAEPIAATVDQTDVGPPEQEKAERMENAPE